MLAASDSGVTETIEGTVLGTAPYISTGQVQGKLLDERSEFFVRCGAMRALIPPPMKRT